MLNDEDYSSDTSDEDFIPQGQDAESDDDEPFSDNENINEDDENAEENSKGKKCKIRKGKVKRKNPLLATVSLEEEVKKIENEEPIEEEQNTKKEEDLWADFLADVDEKPAPVPKQKSTKSWAQLLGNKKDQPTSMSSDHNSTGTSQTNTATKVSVPVPPKQTTVKVTKVFEFAGEEIKVEEEVPANSVEATKAAYQNQITAKGLPATKRPLGLSGVVSMLDNKKQKLTTLQKTKLDWNNFKSSEGIEDELETHKKSKAGFLEKQEFLERADLRQFEIEKAMRINKRSGR